MYKIKAKIQGTTPYLQHKMPEETEEIDKMKQVVKVLQKDPGNVEAYTTEAEISAYKNEDGMLYIPFYQLEAALTSAGVSEKVAGQNRKTYKDYMKAFVIIEPEEMLISPQEYELDRRWVKVQRSRVRRCRPRFPVGWIVDFTLTVLDDTIPFDMVKKILEYAGSYKGIGDYRPKYGRFEVVEFEKVQ